MKAFGAIRRVYGTFQYDPRTHTLSDYVFRVQASPKIPLLTAVLSRTSNDAKTCVSTFDSKVARLCCR
jgi:hypothetical protein